MEVLRATAAAVRCLFASLIVFAKASQRPGDDGATDEARPPPRTTGTNPRSAALLVTKSKNNAKMILIVMLPFVNVEYCTSDATGPYSDGRCGSLIFGAFYFCCFSSGDVSFRRKI